MTSLPRGLVVSALGGTQILAWGSSYYLPAVFANPIAAETGWSLTWVVGGLSLGLLVAGLASPRVGQIINQHGGRLVLAASSVLLALGLVGLSLAQSPATYFLAWLVMGLGMSGGLYDAGFATLGRLYGTEARRLIVGLTLFGGFASTICWPFSAYLVDQYGWRGACLVYAAIHLLVGLPVHLLLVPRPPRDVEAAGDDQTDGGQPMVRIGKERRLVYVLMASAIALCSVISSMVAVHLLTILQAGGMSLASAVALGVMVGPSQVGARVVEMMFGRYYHPIWTMMAATVLVTFGLAILLAGLPVVMLALLLYGAGIGIESIARGTLPLALFGPRNYAALIGSIAMPSLIAQAMSPSVGAILLQYGGATAVLTTLTALAALNVVLVVLLRGAGRKAALPI